MTAQQTIVVDHLARLEDGSIVVAGIDGNHEHIAPLRGSPWDTAATTRAGGPFGIGVAVDIGFSPRRGAPPLVEERQGRGGTRAPPRRPPPRPFWSPPGNPRPHHPPPIHRPHPALAP